MTGSLGIDHPLIAVQDMAKARETYRSLGFTLSPEGMHPWGTATSLALFEKQIIEIVGIGDASLLDGYPAGEFVFGRHVEHHLNVTEGVALSALFTENAEAVETALASRHIVCAGTVNFGRDVVRADGQPDRTKTTLKVFTHSSHPRLSVFACQQHRRDLLEFPHLMNHPNSAHGIAAATIVCDKSDRANVLNWLKSLHGQDVIEGADGDFTVQTSNGIWRVCSATSLVNFFGQIEPEPLLRYGPRIVGIDIRVKTRAQAALHLNNEQVLALKDALVLQDWARYGGVMLRFVD